MRGVPADGEVEQGAAVIGGPLDQALDHGGIGFDEVITLPVTTNHTSIG